MPHKAGRLGLEPRPRILEIRMLPLHYQPMVTGCLRVLALAFTLMTVTAAHAPLSFPPVWSGVLDLNQGLSPYQRDTLPTELTPDRIAGKDLHLTWFLLLLSG